MLLSRVTMAAVDTKLQEAEDRFNSRISRLREELEKGEAERIKDKLALKALLKYVNIELEYFPTKFSEARYEARTIIAKTTVVPNL